MPIRTFEHYPEESKCPICGTHDDKKCMLVAIAGTSKEDICEGQPIHLDCLTSLLNAAVWYPEYNLICIKIPGVKKEEQCLKKKNQDQS